ncbi:microtubial binding protein [Blyttiomyces helicus]|uniref:Autophagy-related protein n=1 Tax=Blyttiomyces helicus TaxID=388810 RepID=A0A4P9WUD9_9FUNG|nr:microtubial binding protein [Blyttiomyces helicus]|eukprot:RKO94706.1 microtubial binding protein [Blyttiomyces helicus]
MVFFGSQSSDISYKDQRSFEERKKECDRILQKYPDRIPIIVERSSNRNDIPQIDKKKYLVPGEITWANLIAVIRKRIRITPEKGLYVFVNGQIVPHSQLVCQIYQENKNECGFLFVTYSLENTFGST